MTFLSSFIFGEAHQCIGACLSYSIVIFLPYLAAVTGIGVPALFVSSKETPAEV